MNSLLPVRSRGTLNPKKLHAKGGTKHGSKSNCCRQLAHVDLGKKVIDDFVEECAEVGQIEKPAKLEGRTLTAILAPKKKK